MNEAQLAALPPHVTRKLEPVPPSECVVYMGSVNSSGYATATIDGRSRLLHRFVYETCVGPIPPGLTIDHVCHVRSCVEPRHMRVVTQRANVLAGEAPAAKWARRADCGKCGRPLVHIPAKRSRGCVECRREYNSQYSKARYAADPAARKAAASAYYKAHRERMNMLARERRRAAKSAAERG